MQTYNPSEFYPRTGQEIKSDGTTVNEADGVNPDGSQNVKITDSSIPVLEQMLINGLAVRDATAHTIATDSTVIFQVAPKKGRKTIGVYNGTNQSITVGVNYAKNDGTMRWAVGSTQTVGTGAIAYITSANIAALVDPIPKLDIQVTASIAPTSGSVSAWLESCD